MAQQLPPQFDPSAIETAWYRNWEERGYFRADPQAVLRDGREPYTIVIPPPNVTAVLHMGHGLNNTIQDVLIRWRRMQGREALWIPGTDHAGIATQNVVERQLAAEGKTRYDLGREAFEKRVWEWVEETKPAILDQLRAIGCSCDWTRTRFTLDPELSDAVREVFVRLHEKGLIYRGEYIINWCPRCLTALSNEEAEPAEAPGELYRLRYPLVAPGSEEAGDGSAQPAENGSAAHAPAADLPRLDDGRPYLVVATTRPETMLGDTAIAVHPDDERYAALVGAEAELPLTGRRIPIVADDWVDPEFGSGAVKVTPAHDPNDFEIGQRHDLDTIDIFTPEAMVNDAAPADFRGLDRFEARERVVDALREQGLLEDVEDYPHSVPHCYRCDTVVEPRLSLQWFVRMKPLAEPALAAAESGELRFTPDRWTGVYRHWMENIRDWCISRQLWWGHRIPVWYCEECGETVVAREDPAECPECGGALEQDPDVLDTWFSSWLWPFTTLGWPEETDDLAAFYPTSALSTAPEILFFWVARMVMAGAEFRGEIPFPDVYLHSTVRDQHGRKMSKSLGNGIDPLEVVERFGADALRYTVIAGAGVGTDVHLNPDDLDEAFAPGRNFANKLWNIGRFALMNLEDAEVRDPSEIADDLELSDRWILSRLARASSKATRALEAFRFHEYAEIVYHYLWSELADWYLELIKPRFSDDDGRSGGTGAPDDGGSRNAAPDDGGSSTAALSTLVAALDGGLRLLHPIMPFITEELWQRLPVPSGAERAESLVIAPWPAAKGTKGARAGGTAIPATHWADPAAEERLEALIELIGAVRAIRSEYNVPARTRVEARLSNVPGVLRDALEGEPAALGELALADLPEEDGSGGNGAEPAADGAGDAAGAGASAVLRSGAELFVPLEGVIDLDRERERLADEVARLEGQLQATEKRLANEQFTTKAPAEVVEREREKAENFRDQGERLARKLSALG